MKNLPGYVIAEKDQEVRRVVKQNLTQAASRHLTICEVLRFTYDTVDQLPDGEIKDDLTEKLIDAMNMGKKIMSRLAHYKRTMGDKTGSSGSGLIKLDHTRRRERIRSQRKI